MNMIAAKAQRSSRTEVYKYMCATILCWVCARASGWVQDNIYVASHTRVCGYAAVKNTNLLFRGSKLIEFHSQAIQQAMNHTRWKLQTCCLSKEDPVGKALIFLGTNANSPFSFSIVYVSNINITQCFARKVDNNFNSNVIAHLKSRKVCMSRVTPTVSSQDSCSLITDHEWKL